MQINTVHFRSLHCRTDKLVWPLSVLGEGKVDIKTESRENSFTRANQSSAGRGCPDMLFKFPSRSAHLSSYTRTGMVVLYVSGSDAIWLHFSHSCLTRMLAVWNFSFFWWFIDGQHDSSFPLSSIKIHFSLQKAHKCVNASPVTLCSYKHLNIQLGVGTDLLLHALVKRLPFLVQGGWFELWISVLFRHAVFNPRLL